MSLLTSLKVFQLDSNPTPLASLKVKTANYSEELPLHTHRKGQLILTLHGGVTCLTEKTYRIIPKNCAVWIPSGLPHSNTATKNSEILLMFIDPKLDYLPNHCCTLKISNVLREMIVHFDNFPKNYEPGSHPSNFANVILFELSQMPIEKLSLSISGNIKIKMLIDNLINNPDDKKNIEDWAKHFAMSKKTFERFIISETGMTFGRWRQQILLLIAIERLVSGVSVQNTAYELGYNSVSAFITMFKKNLGKTPSYYYES